MEDAQSLKDFHRLNLIIWIAILTFITILTIVAFVLDSLTMLQPLAEADRINQIIFVLAVGLAFAILFFKQSLFMPSKILTKIGDKPDSDKINLCLVHLRKNYILVWAMGEAICLLGFVNYILTVNLRYFLAFTVVSLYSVLINMPRMALLKKCGEINYVNK
jgi:hypothetical protein